MPIDIYSTRAQLAAIELMPPEHTFLYDTFVQEMAPVEDDRAIYDYKKGGKPMAPFVRDGAGGILMGRDSYSTKEIGFCTIAPERLIENNQLKGRVFGESVLGAMTPEQREKKMLVRDQMEMRQAIQRRREWMARQVLLTGCLNIFEYTNEGRSLRTTLVADYGFTNKYVPTRWDQAGAKIQSDMEYMVDLVNEGSADVDVFVMDAFAYHAMLENSKYIDLFDKRHVNVGEIRPRYKDAGVRYIGTNIDGVDMYCVSGSFIDDDGVVTKILPKGTVIAGSRGMLKCIHGPVTQVEDYGPNAKHKTYIKKEVPLRLGSPESNSISNRITSRPTIVPFNVDAWVVATVL